MAATTTWNGSDIPRVATVNERRVLIGDSGRSISGKMLYTHVVSKKVWEVTTTLLRQSEYDTILAMLDGIAWLPGLFWNETVGEDPVEARISPDSFRTNHIPVGFHNGWDKWAKTITFAVEEM